MKRKMVFCSIALYIALLSRPVFANIPNPDLKKNIVEKIVENTDVLPLLIFTGVMIGLIWCLSLLVINRMKKKNDLDA